MPFNAAFVARLLPRLHWEALLSAAESVSGTGGGCWGLGWIWGGVGVFGVILGGIGVLGGIFGGLGVIWGDLGLFGVVWGGIGFFGGERNPQMGIFWGLFLGGGPHVAVFGGGIPN